MPPSDFKRGGGREASRREIAISVLLRPPSTSTLHTFWRGGCVPPGGQEEEEEDAFFLLLLPRKKKEKKDSPPEWTKKKSYFQKMLRKEGEKDEEGRIKYTSFFGSRLSVKVGGGVGWPRSIKMAQDKKKARNKIHQSSRPMMENDRSSA